MNYTGLFGEKTSFKPSAFGTPSKVKKIGDC